MFSTFKKYWPLLVIVVLEMTLFVANFRSGTYLVGWDNLYPELNLSANFDRNVFAVWQEYRGVGLLDGMAHAANLPHTLFIWLLDFFLPTNLLRYLFVHLMHLLGGLGMYSLLKNAILKNKQSRRPISLVGALFYLFNLTTIQIFYAPLEVFLVHFAFLPWLIYTLLNYSRKPSLKSLVPFILFSILSLPQGFVPQVFIVYLLLVSLILLVEFLRERKQALVKIGVIILTIFCINAFWGLPYIYSAFNSSGVIREAKINQMSSGDVFLKNKARGTLEDVLLLKGFMLDVMEFDEKKYSYIMQPWRMHINSFLFSLTSSLFLVLALLGLGRILLKQKPFYPFAVTFVLSGIILGSNIWGIESLNTFIRTQFPIFGEAFRFSFTKFGVLFAFCYTILFSIGISFFVRNLTKIYPNLLGSTFLLIASFSLLIYAYPVLDGKFLFDKLRLSVPADYFQTIEFFKSQNSSERIAIFPQATFWSWRYRDWEYRGSDFFWYGIEQPTLDRAFDPWSRQNENYYWEMSYAVYSGNTGLLEKVLEKYHVNWIIVDGHVTNPMSPKALYFDELAELVVSSPKIKFAQKFGEIKVYRVDLEAPVNNYVFLAQNLPSVSPTYKWNNYDRAFIENNHYLSGIENSIYYPFRSVFTGKEQRELEFEIEEKENMFIFRKHFDVPENQYISVPSTDPKKYVWIDPNNLSHQKFLSPDIVLNSKFIEVYIPKINGYLSSWISPAEAVPQTEECQGSGKGKVENQIVENGDKKLLRLISIDTNNCSATFWLPNVPHNLGYIMTIEGRNIQGKKLVFWLENQNSRKPDIEIHLLNGKLSTSYIVQPPMEDDGVGYTLHFDNLSIGNEKTINDLGKITINPLPYEFLTNLSLRPINQESKPVVYYEVEAEHPNPSLYIVDTQYAIRNTEDEILVLSQAYHQGWKAYVITQNAKRKTQMLSLFVPFLGKELKEHVLVNNWANGWILDSRYPIHETKIVLIFLPQYLQYLGFFLLFAFGVLIFVGPRLPRLRHGEKPVIYYREKYGRGPKEEKTKQTDDPGN